MTMSDSKLAVRLRSDVAVPLRSDWMKERANRYLTPRQGPFDAKEIWLAQRLIHWLIRLANKRLETDWVA
jgi:hypothetical protein